MRWADEPKIPSTMGLGRPPSPAHVRSRPETTRGVSPECPLSFHRSNPGVATGPASRPRCRCTRRLGHGTTEQKRGLSARLRKPRWAAARRDVGTRPLPRWVQAARRKRHEPCVCAGPSRGTRPPTRRRGRSRRLRTRSRCSPRSRPHRREVLGRLLLPAEAVVSSWSDGLVIRQPTRAGRRQRHARHEPTHTRAGRPPCAPRRPLAVCCTRLRAAPVPALRCRQRARPRLRDRAWHNPDRAPAACPGAQAAMRRVGDAMARVVARRSARRGFWFASGGPEAEENGTTTRHAQSSRLRASPSLNEAARDRSRPSPSRSATSSPQPRCARARRRGRPGRGPHASPGAFGNATRHRQGAPPYLSRPRSCHTRRTDFSAPVAFARERARTFERTQSFQLHTPHPRTRSVRLVVRTPSACCVVARQNESE